MAQVADCTRSFVCARCDRQAWVDAGELLHHNLSGSLVCCAVPSNPLKLPRKRKGAHTAVAAVPSSSDNDSSNDSDSSDEETPLWDARRDKKLIRGRAAGDSFAKIAAALDMTDSDARARYERLVRDAHAYATNPEPKPKRVCRRWTEEENQEVLEAHAAGKKPAEIGKRFGLNSKQMRARIDGLLRKQREKERAAAAPGEHGGAPGGRERVKAEGEGPSSDASQGSQGSQGSHHAESDDEDSQSDTDDDE